MFLFSVEKEMKLRSHAVQRNLPRPLDVNENILRNAGPDDPPLSELQKVRVRVVVVLLSAPPHNFIVIDCEIFSTVILLLLIQEGLLSITSKSVCTEYWLTA